MPKDIFLSLTSEVTVQNRRPENEILKFPKKFKSNITLDLPVTIQPGGTLVLTGPQLDKKPYDIDLVYSYFKDNSATEASNIFTHSIGMFSHQTEVTQKRFNRDVIKQKTTRLFNVPDEEKKGSGDPLLGRFVNNAGATHLFHTAAVGSDLVFKDFDVDLENNLKLTYENIGTTPIVLHKPLTMEPLIPTAFPRTVGNQIARCFGNKVLVTGHKFGRHLANPPTFEDNDEMLVHTITNGQITSTVNISDPSVITWGPQPSSDSYLNFGCVSGCVNALDANEFFVAFTTYNNKVLLYDSRNGGTWEDKTGGSITTQPPGLSVSDFRFTYPHDSGSRVSALGGLCRTGRPMDMKHISSTGTVHAVVCGFADTLYEPRIALSVDNLETFTTIFDNTTLATLNITPFDYNSRKNKINTEIYTKMIDENTFFVKTSVFGEYNSGEYQFPLNLLLKTTDAGSTWTDIMEDHLEYRTAGNTTMFISENGMDIYVMIFYTNPTEIADDSEVTLSGDTPPLLTIPSDVYNLDPDTRVIKMNYSNDGGATWAYPSGSWIDIPVAGITSAFIASDNWIIGKENFSGASQGGPSPFIFREKTTNAIIVGFVIANYNGGYAYYTSNDNGNTWKPYTVYSQNDIAGQLLDGYQHGSRNAFTEYFLSPHDYTDEHLVSVGSLEATPPDVGDPNTVYKTQEAAFLKQTTINLDNTRYHRSGMVITHINDSVLIDKVEGHYT